MLIPVIAALLTMSLPSAAAEEAARQDTAVIRKYLRDVYNFRPHLLSQRQIDQESKTLDEFWSRARAQPDLYIRVLREELANCKDSPFFLYDGSKLLLTLSDTEYDRRLAVWAIAQCDLRDVQHLDYLLQVHRLAVRGEDATAAAFNILGTANFRAFVAQHALMLGQDYALVVMLLPMEADKWVGEVIKQLEIETSPTAQRSLLLVLWYAQTDIADHALQTFAANAGKPAASRTYARGLTARSQAINRLPTAQIPPDSESELRSKRREVMKRVSDEALLELDQLTLFLMAKRKVRPPG
jgi:uncharacterized protein (DUF2267 family)